MIDDGACVRPKITPATFAHRVGRFWYGERAPRAAFRFIAVSKIPESAIARPVQAVVRVILAANVQVLPAIREDDEGADLEMGFAATSFPGSTFAERVLLLAPSNQGIDGQPI